MTTWYVDAVNGVDANAGTSWGTAKKKLYSIGSSLVAGDSVRVAKTPDGVVLNGLTPSYASAANAYFTLNATVNTKVLFTYSDFTAANGGYVSSGTAMFYENSVTNLYGYNQIISFPAGAAANTKYAYLPITAVNLSAFQAIHLYVAEGPNYALADGHARVCLCSDALGNTIVDSFSLVFDQSTSNGWNGTTYGIVGKWCTIQRTGGGNLGSSIASIAIYSGANPTPSSDFFYGWCLACFASPVLVPGDWVDFSDPDAVSLEVVWITSGETATPVIEWNTYGDGSPSTALRRPPVNATLTRYRPVSLPRSWEVSDYAYGGFSIPGAGGTTNNRISISGGWDTSNNTRDGVTFYDFRLGPFMSAGTAMQGIDISNFWVWRGNRGLLLSSVAGTVEYTCTNCRFINYDDTSSLFNNFTGTTTGRSLTKARFTSCFFVYSYLTFGWQDYGAFLSAFDFGFTDCKFNAGCLLQTAKGGSIFLTNCVFHSGYVYFAARTNLAAITLTNVTISFCDILQSTNAAVDNLVEVRCYGTNLFYQSKFYFAPGCRIYGPLTIKGVNPDLLGTGVRTGVLSGYNSYLYPLGRYGYAQDVDFEHYTASDELMNVRMKNCTLTYTGPSTSGSISLPHYAEDCTFIHPSTGSGYGWSAMPPPSSMSGYVRLYNCVFKGQMSNGLYVRNAIVSGCTRYPGDAAAGAVLDANSRIIDSDFYMSKQIYGNEFPDELGMLARSYNYLGDGLHKAIGDRLTITQQTTSRHTTDGKAWNLAVGTTQLLEDESILPLGRAIALAGSTLTAKVWVNPNGATLGVALKARRGQFEPTQPELRNLSTGTGWQQLSVSYLATNSGVMEFYVTLWGTALYTSYAVDVDDFEVITE